MLNNKFECNFLHKNGDHYCQLKNRSPADGSWNMDQGHAGKQTSPYVWDHNEPRISPEIWKM